MERIAGRLLSASRAVVEWLTRDSRKPRGVTLLHPQWLVIRL